MCELEAGPADSTREGILTMNANWRASPNTKIESEEQMDASSCWDQDTDNALGRIARSTDRTFEVSVLSSLLYTRRDLIYVNVVI